MNALQTEERSLSINMSLPFDLAKHMAGRLELGQIVIVSKQPATLLASVRKQWLRVLRQVENKRAGIMDAAKVTAYTKKIARMQTSSFAVMDMSEGADVDMVFATSEQLLQCAPTCQTTYVATPTDKATLHKVTSFMPPNGLVVIYRLKSTTGK